MLDTMFCYTSRLALKLAIFKSHKNPVSASQMSTLWRHLHRSQFWTDRSIVLMSSWVKSSWQAASWGGNTVRKAIGLAKQQGLQSGKGEEPSLLFYNLLGYKIHSVLETQLSPQEQHWSLLGGGGVISIRFHFSDILLFLGVMTLRTKLPMPRPLKDRPYPNLNNYHLWNGNCIPYMVMSILHGLRHHPTV